MNLQSKFMYAIGGAFIVTFAVAQTIQLWNVDRQISTIGDQVVTAMNASGQQTIEALQRREDAVMALTGRFLQKSVGASLERGEMDKFRRLVEDQKDVPGLLEFSLYNTDNTIGYSTRDANLGRALPADVASQLANRVEPLRLDNGETVQLYLPQEMNSDCVRCHREWADRPTAGTLFVEMSTETLMQAKADADASVDQAKRDIGAALEHTERSMVVTSLSAAAVTLIVLGTVLALLVRFQLTRRFGRFLGAFEQFSAHGDLTSRVDDESRDELGQLSRGFNDFTSKLAETVTDIRQLADRVHQRSDGILDRSRAISTGVDEQRNDLSAVATAVTEMAQSANTVAESANQASAASGESSDAAKSGQRVINDTLHRIHDIQQASDRANAATDEMSKVADEVRAILAAISAISNQTSLLALNAAIEAARAGESGRGFAVVADEVRTLASRAATATQQVAEAIDRIDHSAGSVQDAIGQMAEKVSEGSELAASAGERLGDIVQRASEIADVANHVAVATTEQSSVSDEISQNTHRLLGSAESNSRAAEQTAEHATELGVEAEALANMIHHFKT